MYYNFIVYRIVFTILYFIILLIISYFYINIFLHLFVVRHLFHKGINTLQKSSISINSLIKTNNLITLFSINIIISEKFIDNIKQHNVT